MHNILDFTLEELQNWMKDNGESAFTTVQGSQKSWTQLHD